MAGHSVRGLYTHLVCLREGQASLRSRWSLQILCFFLTCGLNAFLSPTHFTKKKSLCFAQAFLFGGNRRASSAGALNPCRARLGIASRSPLPLVAADSLSFSCLRLERGFSSRPIPPNKKPMQKHRFFIWWKRRGSNPRPHGCEPCALTS